VQFHLINVTIFVYQNVIFLNVQSSNQMLDKTYAQLTSYLGEIFDKMSLNKMPFGLMSLNKMSFGLMSLNQMSFGLMSLDIMLFVIMSIGIMSFGLMPFCKSLNVKFPFCKHNLKIAVVKKYNSFAGLWKYLVFMSCHLTSLNVIRQNVALQNDLNVPLSLEGSRCTSGSRRTNVWRRRRNCSSRQCTARSSWTSRSGVLRHKTCFSSSPMLRTNKQECVPL
jgi:hypothetical protein